MPNLVGSVARAAHKTSVVFHGAGICRASLSYLFLGTSGSGKSTLAALGDTSGIAVIADEWVMVLEKGEQFHVRPLPLQTQTEPVVVPIGCRSLLHRVFFLAKSPHVAAERVSPIEAIRRCLGEDLIQRFRLMPPRARGVAVDRLIRLFRTVPAYVLHFRKDNSFWKVIDELEEKEPAK